MGLVPDFELPSWEDVEEGIVDTLRAIPGHSSIEDGVCWLDAFVGEDDAVGESDDGVFYCYDTPNLEASERTRERYELESGWVASPTGFVNEIWQFILKGIGVAYTAFGGLPFAGLLTMLNGYMPKKPDPVYSKRKDSDPMPDWRVYSSSSFLARQCTGSSWNLPTWSNLPADSNERSIAASWVVGTGLFETKAEASAWLSRA